MDRDLERRNYLERGNLGNYLPGASGRSRLATRALFSRLNGQNMPSVNSGQRVNSRQMMIQRASSQPLVDGSPAHTIPQGQSPDVHNDLHDDFVVPNGFTP